jgi:hypothetical protein
MAQFSMKDFNFKELNSIEGIEQYYVEISSRITILENLDAEVKIVVLRKLR